MNIHWIFCALTSCLAHDGCNWAAGSALSGALFALSEMLEMSPEMASTSDFSAAFQVVDMM